MATVDYMDERIAIIRLQDGDSPTDTDAVRALLSVRLDGRCRARDLRGAVEAVGALFGDTFALVPDGYEPDTAKLERLGFRREDGTVFEAGDVRTIVNDGGYFHIRRVLGLGHLAQLAEALQFLARLHLFATGDERSQAVMPPCASRDANDPWHVVQFVAPVPQLLERFGYKEAPYAATVERIGEGARVTLDAGHWPSGVPVSVEWSEAQHMAARRYAAASLLACTLAGAHASRYAIDPQTLELRIIEESNILDTLAEIAAGGKITACPHCGQPVARLRDSATPFCNKGHAVRYNEKAKRRFKKGMSAEEVLERFPYLGRETVENWQREV